MDNTERMAVYPQGMLAKLLPDLSPLHRWMHGQMKNWVRELVNKIGESSEMQRIYEIKTDEGWINYEVKLLHDWLGELIEKERIVWGPKSNGQNERFWTNFRIVLCCSLDEDSYYLVRYLNIMEIAHRDYEKLHIEDYHKNRAYWDWEELKEQLKIQAENALLKRQGFEFPDGKKESKDNKEP